ncbi:hypothetical protein HH800_15690 [Sphingobium yanoikuyae]|uniref:Uncharacterized protein n=1 Tax=Sphingobium yanoikuyae TaxID=13690 RepID=A0A6M4GB16_SPHYA|nr:hypothetical protein [Sphingobium yanoikuyae]QJR03493.1 hypothetical protein HH800_15690 [Sphingobium yanoikuyae]
MTNEPTTHMVAEVIVREMMGWDSKANEKQRRNELYGLADALIRYFAVFKPTAKILPGLPGGDALNLGGSWDGTAV